MITVSYIFTVSPFITFCSLTSAVLHQCVFWRLGSAIGFACLLYPRKQKSPLESVVSDDLTYIGYFSYTIVLRNKQFHTGRPSGDQLVHSWFFLSVLYSTKEAMLEED